MNDFFSSKRLIASILAAAVLSVAAVSAQTREEKKALKDSLNAAKVAGAHLSGKTIRLDGVKLNEEQQSLLLSDIDNKDFNDIWREYEKDYILGRDMTIGGTCLTVVGVAAGVVGLGTMLIGALFAAVGDDSMVRTGGYITLGGAVGTGAGIITTATGATIRKKAAKKMHSVCDGYNNAGQRIEKEIILGGTASGVGIAFNF